MNGTVIDTLRYADRLKQSGVAPRQAEAMSRALNDELTEGLVTRTDLDQAVTSLQTNLDQAVTSLQTNLDLAVTSLRARVGALEKTVNERFEGVDAKFEALRSQNRYVFLVLALIAGLGFFNAVAPYVADKGTPPTAPDRAAPAAQLPMPGSNGRTASGT